MNEPDIMNNKYQLHLAMTKARTLIPQIFTEYEQLSGRTLKAVQSYKTDDAQVLMFVLGSEKYIGFGYMKGKRRHTGYLISFCYKKSLNDWCISFLGLP